MGFKGQNNSSYTINKFLIFIVLCISFGHISAQTANIQTGVSMGSNRDHDLAISNNGWTINASNAEISFGGNTPTSFSGFMTLFGGTGSIIDPDIFYDPTIDCFFISGMINNVSSPGIILLKSNTATPTGSASDWQSFVYTHPLNSFLDFPRLAVNQDKVLISFKLLDNGHYSPAFFTLDKNAFNGASTLMTPSISADMEFICPVNPAQTADFSRTDFYFIGMDKICTTGSNRIFLFHLDANGAFTEQILNGSITYYSNASGTNSGLTSNNGSFSLFSNRVWSAVINNANIHFVSHFLENTTNNQSSIYYGNYDISTGQFTSWAFSKTDEYRYYPSLALMSNANNVNNPKICLNFLCHNATQVFWKSIISDGTLSREYIWASYKGRGINLGDYTAAQQKYNEPSRVFISGQLPNNGTSNQGYYTNIETSSVIPLELVHFDAKSTKTEQVNLKWTTLNESNVKHFEIQRSTTAKNWQILDSVKARNTNQRQDYSFVDSKIEQAGIEPQINQKEALYYRLRIVDFDNSETFSTIQAIHFADKNGTISLYPNPATTGIFIKWASEGKIRAEISDQLGRVLTTKELELKDNQAYFPFENLRESGVYTLKVFKNNKLIDIKSFSIP